MRGYHLFVITNSLITTLFIEGEQNIIHDFVHTELGHLLNLLKRDTTFIEKGF